MNRVGCGHFNCADFRDYGGGCHVCSDVGDFSDDGGGGVDVWGLSMYAFPDMVMVKYALIFF